MTSTENSHPIYTASDYAMTNRFLARRYFNNRDAKGRFTKRTHVDEVLVTGGRFFTDSVKSHSTPTCGNLKGEFVVESDPTGWLCSTCVHVPVSTQVLAEAEEFVSKSGTQECVTCRLTKKVTSFPTVLVPGVMRHRGDVCRSCESDRRPSGRFVPEC